MRIFVTNTNADSHDSIGQETWHTRSNLLSNNTGRKTVERSHHRLSSLPACWTGVHQRISSQTPALIHWPLSSLRYLFYESAIKRNTRSGRPRKTYRQQISSHIHPDEPLYEVDLGLQINHNWAIISSWHGKRHHLIPQLCPPNDDE